MSPSLYMMGESLDDLYTPNPFFDKFLFGFHSVRWSVYDVESFVGEY